MIPSIRWLCCLGLLGLFGSPLRAEDNLRQQLEEVVFESRLRDLGLRLAREAYQAHALALEEQPAKLGVVRYYQGLVEMEAQAPQ
ncbi:MAG: hypothetical protein KDA84_00650, partial [Planctomycetaceae bacterium]|nr:hypothetical protein [Planctomycetaceae bacterium]